MVEAGVPVDKFFAFKPQTRFTTTKALVKLANQKRESAVAEPAEPAEPANTDSFLETLLSLGQSDTASTPEISVDSLVGEGAAAGR